MMPLKKLYFFLLLIIALSAFLFFKEFRKSAGITTTPLANPLISQNATAIPLNETDPLYGNPGAAITLVEFIDLGCAKCQKLHYLLTKLVDQNPAAVRLIWKDAPNYGGLISKGTYDAHVAGVCAFKLGKNKKFWDFTRLAMQDKTNLRPEGLNKIADGLKINQDQWANCLNSPEIKQKLEQTAALSEQIGLSATPALFVDNQRVNLDTEISLEDLLTKIITNDYAAP